MTAEQHNPEADDPRGQPAPAADETAADDEQSSWRTMHRRQFLRAFTPGVIAILGIAGTEGDDDPISIRPDD